MLTHTKHSLRTYALWHRSAFDTDKLARLDAAELVDVRPHPEERRLNHLGNPSHYFDFVDAKTRQAEYERDRAAAEDELYGDGSADNPGSLFTYSVHRRTEESLASYLHDTIVPYCADRGEHERARYFEELSLKFVFCRRMGPFGINGDGKLVVAWHAKCGKSKYCPDEAREESLRLKEVYVPAIQAHVDRGGRVYKAVLSPPNYPAGRLREGMRHEFKRFRDRAIRALEAGRNKWGIAGALVIQEAPLGRDRDWNVHLNVILLTRGWFDYKAFQAAFAPVSLNVRKWDRFDDVGMARLFNECIKYACRTVAEKSADGHHDVAPAMVEWQPWEFLEWHDAHKGFRRTRAYGCLHGLGRPEKQLALPTQWIGKLEYHGPSYKVHWAATTFRLAIDDAIWHAEVGDLFSIRGDKSTTKVGHRGRAPP